MPAAPPTPARQRSVPSRAARRLLEVTLAGLGALAATLGAGLSLVGLCCGALAAAGAGTAATAAVLSPWPWPWLLLAAGAALITAALLLHRRRDCCPPKPTPSARGPRRSG